MAQGDTTVRIDFETGGASSARMTVQDVYRAAEQTLKGANMRMLTEEQKRAKSVIELDKQRQKYRRQNAMKEFQDQENERKRQLDSVASLAKQRGEWMLKNYNEEQAELKRNNRIKLAEEKRALRESLREKKMALKEQERMQKMQEAQSGSVNKLLGRGAWGAVMGVAGYAGVAGVSNMIQGLSNSIENFTSKRTDLERTITPLASIGDNIGNLSSLRKEVVSLAASTGLSTDDVAGFLNDLESSTGNLKPEVVKQLKDEIVELTQVKGGNIGEMGQLMVSAWQIAGKELKNVNELQNKIAYTEEIGKAKISQLANYLPTVMNTADLLGININEILGTVAGGSLKTGNIEKLMTGLRNFLLIMEQAPSKGINLVGTYTQKLEQLNELFKTNKAGMIDLFDREVVDAAYQIVSNVDDVKNSIAKLDAMPSTGDIVADKLKSRLDDITSQAAMLDTLYKTLIERAPNLTSEGDMTSLAYKVHEKAQMAFLGGSKISGGSSVGGYLGVAGSLIGMNNMAELGNKAAIDFTKPGPKRDILLRQQFELQKQADLQKLYGTNEMAKSKWGGLLGFDWDSERIKSIKSREFNIDDARARNPYSEQIGPVMASKEARDLVEALNKNTQATLATAGSGPAIKPGGSKTNAEETL